MISANSQPASSPSFTDGELAALRADFPILSKRGRGGEPIAYFDAGATTQKPLPVTSALTRFYQDANGAINRGTHLLADTATEAFTAARQRVADFFNVDPDEVVWTSGATAAINLVATACLKTSLGVRANPDSPFYVGAGDRIVITRAEHHANLIPWQELAGATGAELAWLDLDDAGQIDLATLETITPNTKIVACSHMSNVTGAISPLPLIVRAARAVGALILADTCQSAAHLPLDMSQLGVDFAVASGHKMLGPTGIGILWGRGELLAQMPAVNTGGSMITSVTMAQSHYLDAPNRFEPGTQPVAQAVGWAAALDYLDAVGMDRIAAHEEHLGAQLATQLREVPGLRILGSRRGEDHHGVLAFTLGEIHPHDIGQVLDAHDIAVRVGHHCAIPLHRHLGVNSSARATVSLTSTPAEIERLVAGLYDVTKYFAN